MSKATEELLARIHAKMAEAMLEKLESGEAEAKDWAVIVKFLKDNNIDVAPGAGGDNESALERLIKAAQQSHSAYQ